MNCVKCHSPATVICAKCFEPYCSLSCQLKDWFSHKKVCVPMPDLVPIDVLLHQLKISPETKNVEEDNAREVLQVKVSPGDGLPKTIQRSPPAEVAINTILKETQYAGGVIDKKPLEVVAVKNPEVTACTENNKSDRVSEPQKLLHALELRPLKPDTLQKPVTPKFVLNDIKCVPISEGKNIQLIVVDTSQIKQRVIGALEYEENASREMNKNLLQLREHCKNAEKTNAGYSPQPDELCLAVFHEDGEWYRAVVVKEINGCKYIVQFIDYGNIAEVSSANITPITEELLFPTYTNLCFIKTNELNLPKVEAVIESNPIILCDVHFNKIMDMYEITLKNTN